MRLLILQDQPDDAELMLLALREFGYAPEWRRVADEAHFLAALNPEVDVILADFNLPGFDALQALERLHERDLDIPFIVVTGSINEEVAVACMRQGATDYLIRDRLARLGPAVERALQDKLARVQKQRAEQALRQSEERYRVMAESSTQRATELRVLSQRLVEVQESERRFIAQELHDEIGQLLTGLKLLLQLDTPGSNTPQALDIVDELIAHVRRLSLDMRPPVLDNLGLLPALLWLIQRYSAQTGVHVQFGHDGIEGCRFSSVTETAVYRIVQEALTNIARYAGVQAATVCVRADAAWLEVRIIDEGRGFNPRAAAAQGRSAGLTGMRERAASLGGNLSIQSEPGHGTQLIAMLPRTVPEPLD